MSRRYVTTIVMYGDISNSVSQWASWYDYAVNQALQLGYIPNYIGVIGQSFASGKINLIKRIDKRLRKALSEGEEFSSIAIYSLPDGYNQAAFDYEIYLSRDTQEKSPHIIFTIPSDSYKNLDENSIIKELKRFINFTNGQVFEMLSSESPQFYAAKVNLPEVYKSLKILREF